MKKCSFCKAVKMYAEFYPDKRASHGLSSQCKTCINRGNHERYKRRRRNDLIGERRKAREWMASWRKRNPEKHHESNRKYFRELRRQALVAYGGEDPSCACCGQFGIEFLAIDHINGGGTKHRDTVGLGARFFIWLKSQEYPTGYQVLCHNCNSAKGVRSECPHKANLTVVRV